MADSKDKKTTTTSTTEADEAKKNSEPVVTEKNEDVVNESSEEYRRDYHESNDSDPIEDAKALALENHNDSLEQNEAEAGRV